MHNLFCKHWYAKVCIIIPYFLFQILFTFQAHRYIFCWLNWNTLSVKVTRLTSSWQYLDSKSLYANSPWIHSLLFLFQCIFLLNQKVGFQNLVPATELVISSELMQTKNLKINWEVYVALDLKAGSQKVTRRAGGVCLDELILNCVQISSPLLVFLLGFPIFKGCWFTSSHRSQYDSKITLFCLFLRKLFFSINWWITPNFLVADLCYFSHTSLSTAKFRVVVLNQ